MYNLIKSNRQPPGGVGFDDELCRVNFVALFETNGHTFNGDVQFVLESLQGKQFTAEDSGVNCEIFDTLYSHPSGFAYVGLSTDQPEKMYPYMMNTAMKLPGQLSFIGIFPYDGVDGSACDNGYIQKLGTANIEGPTAESDTEWVINIYSEMRGVEAEDNPEDWRDVINNCMFWLGIPEVGESIERTVQDVDNNLEDGDVELAVEAVLTTELRPYVLRALIYFSLLQDLREYVSADAEVE